jgi:hypothetical protein
MTATIIASGSGTYSTDTNTVTPNIYGVNILYNGNIISSTTVSGTVINGSYILSSNQYYPTNYQLSIVINATMCDGTTNNFQFNSAGTTNVVVLAGTYNFTATVTLSSVTGGVWNNKVSGQTSVIVGKPISGVNVSVGGQTNPRYYYMNTSQTATFTASGYGSDGTYSYTWYVDNASVGTGSSYVFSNSTVGGHILYCVATDSYGFTAQSPNINIQVYSVPSYIYSVLVSF